MNMTGLSTQGGTMGNSLGMLGFGNSAAAIPFSPGVNPTRNEAGTGLVQKYARIEQQRMPPGMPLYPFQSSVEMLQPVMGGNQYISGGNLASMQAGNIGGMARMPMGRFSDPMTRKKVL